MGAEVPIKAEEMTGEQLVEVFKLFCQAYKITYSDDFHGAVLSLSGLESLHNGRLDYRPYMGAKFFGSGRENGTYFHGYSDALDPWPSDAGKEPASYKKQKEKLAKQQANCDKKFERLVLEHFKKV